MTVSTERLTGLISTKELEAARHEPKLRIFDCTCYLIPDPEKVYTVKSGREDYDKGHIPGAGFLDLPGQLSDKESRLRFMMPPVAQFEKVLSAAGVSDDSRVVLYARDNVHWATRIWWMLRAFGFDNAEILEGNFERWEAEGRPISTEPANYPPGRFKASPRPELIADKTRVLAAVSDGASCIINALSEEQHAGRGVHYGRPGRIRNSSNVPARSMSDADGGNYLAPASLAAKFSAAGVTPDKPVIAYCGGGIAASNTAFVLSQLGYDQVALYDASLSEWVKDPNLPMDTD